MHPLSFDSSAFLPCSLCARRAHPAWVLFSPQSATEQFLVVSVAPLEARATARDDEDKDDMTNTASEG